VDETPRSVLPTVPAIQFDVVCKRVMDDTELALELIKKTDSNLRQDLVEFETAVETRDANRLMMISHKVKGSAANLSADPLRDACAQLELLSRSADWGAIFEAMPPLRRAIVEFHAAVEEIITSH
jgi:HPt (histidine-containing phosphotransfer) domain-containing protein